MRQIVTLLARKGMPSFGPLLFLWPTHVEMTGWHNCLRGKGKRCVCVCVWGTKNVSFSFFIGFVTSEGGSGSSNMVRDLWEHVGTLFLSQLQMLPHTYSVNTHPVRADEAASGYKMINDRQNEFSPLMTHDYTCLQSCAREVFTSPRAWKWQFHGRMSCLSVSATSTKHPDISLCSWQWTTRTKT